MDLFETDVLEQLQEPIIPEGKTLRTFKLMNAGKPTLITSMSLVELNHYSAVANNRLNEEEQAQRALNMPHANGLALYILKSLLDSTISRMRLQGKQVNEAFINIQNKIGKQNYYTIAPIVANLRNNTIGDIRRWTDRGNEVLGHLITLQVGDVLWIVDGQHRRKAIDIVIDYLKYINYNYKYPGKGSLFSDHKERLTNEEIEVWNECQQSCAYCKVAIEIHIGLDVNQERQLFYDLNSLGKKVDYSLANKFDSSNPINNYVTEVLKDDIFSDYRFEILDSSTEADWNEELPSITRKSLSAINAILFLNKGNVNGATPTDINEDKKSIVNRFWNYVLTIPKFLETHPKLKTVAAQPVVLKAIAKLFFDCFFSKNETLNNQINQDKLLNGLQDFDFSHNNLAWQYYILNEEERNASGLSGLKEYLPLDGEGYNRDMGGYDKVTNTFRFGAKHNDIAPLIGDIIRWHCQLPSRQK